MQSMEETAAKKKRKVATLNSTYQTNKSRRTAAVKLRTKFKEIIFKKNNQINSAVTTRT